MELVQDNKSLKKITKSLKKNDVLYIDTEFLRNNTYWPKLCLIQIKAKKKIYLIDTLAKIDINELKEILTDSLVLNFTEEQLNDFNFNMLSELGYSNKEIDEANTYCCGTMTLEEAPHIKDEHLSVFDCANPCF